MRRLFAALGLALATSAAAQPADKSFNSRGVQIRYIEAGAGDPVLLIHGYTASIETNWIRSGVFQDLAKDHRVIAFDLRGHGKSGKPTDPAAYGSDMVDDAIRLLDHLGIQRAHIVGYSLGAIITAKLLTTNPDRFMTATLGGHAGYRNWKPEYDRNVETRATELEQSDVPFRGLVVAMTPSDVPKRTEEEIRALSAELAAANDVKALAAYQRAGTRAVNSTHSAMAAVRVPTLGIIGSLDNVPSMNQLKTVLPSLKVVVIDGATHTGDRGAPRRSEFVKAIRDFIGAQGGK